MNAQTATSKPPKPLAEPLVLKIFKPAAEPITYLRGLHMFMMFPLGIAYFVSLVVLLSVGGSLIWTFPGMVIVLAAIFGSRLVGDAESAVVGRLADIEIRRPPWRTEDIEGWRARVWARLIDPTTWTGILYLFVQFPIGIGAFVSLVATLSASGGLIAMPLIVHFRDEPLEITGPSFTVDTPLEALWFVPLGIVLFLITTHFVNGFSFLHSRWAKFVLGSRAKARPGTGTPVETTPPEEPSPTPATRQEPTIASGTKMGEIRVFEPPGVQDDTSRTLPAVADPLINDLTQREREVLLVLARGMTNAEIAEEFFISQGTVKTHVKRIFSKLQLNDRAQAIVYAYETGLVTPTTTGKPGSPEQKSLGNPSA